MQDVWDLVCCRLDCLPPYSAAESRGGKEKPRKWKNDGEMAREQERGKEVGDG